MVEEASVPHCVLLLVIVCTVVALPTLLGDQSLLAEAIAGIFSPIAFLLLPLILLLLIRFLSSDRAAGLSDLFAAEPNSIHRVGGSPIGVALLLLVIFFLLYNRISLFGPGDEDSGE